MIWLQKTIELGVKPRGFHLITNELIAELVEICKIDIGILHLFIRHTSASLSVNENADPDVRADMEMAINKIVPQTFPYIHTAEGPDDMPAHVKAALIGHSVSLPIARGKLDLGTWQGIYLGEHRDRGGARKITATLSGKPLSP